MTLSLLESSSKTNQAGPSSCYTQKVDDFLASKMKWERHTLSQDNYVSFVMLFSFGGHQLMALIFEGFSPW